MRNVALSHAFVREIRIRNFRRFAEVHLCPFETAPDRQARLKLFFAETLLAPSVAQ